MDNKIKAPKYMEMIQTEGWSMFSEWIGRKRENCIAEMTRKGEKESDDFKLIGEIRGYNNILDEIKYTIESSLESK